MPMSANLRLVPPLLDPSSLPSSATCSPPPSTRFQLQMLRLANKAQVLVLKNPTKALFLLSVIERFVDLALRDA